MWDTDTMDGQVKSLYGNRYAQVLSNGTYFATKYPMDRKSDTRQALRMFVMELGVLVTCGQKTVLCWSLLT